MTENIKKIETATSVVKEMTAEKPYTFRPLSATDMMPMFRIIGKIGIDEFSECFNSDAVKSIMNKKGTVTDVVGLKVFLSAANVVIQHLPDCETEIFELLSSVCGLPVDKLKAFGFVTYTRMLIEFFKKEEFRDFIGVVSELFK